MVGYSIIVHWIFRIRFVFLIICKKECLKKKIRSKRVIVS